MESHWPSRGFPQPENRLVQNERRRRGAYSMPSELWAELEILSPMVVADLPAGGRRILQEAKGYDVTIKSGVVTFEHGEQTGERPGVLLRGSR